MYIIWFLFWQAAGILAAAVFCGKSASRAADKTIWLGSVTGSVLSAWSPVPFAFIFGFTVKAHAFALLAGALFAVVLIKRVKLHPAVSPGEKELSAEEYAVAAVFLLFSSVLLCNHTLKPYNGGLYTGQCTFGDMAMHLGFITSIAEQQFFPPLYNLVPDTRLCYPFLCDSISSSLYLLGADLRTAYMLPSLFALAQVFTGFMFISRRILKDKQKSIFAFLLFFLNGGLGTVYFLNGDYSFSQIFTDFYKTPTNLTERGIRWVNVIADMLIPQRATLYGWAALFACLYLLYRAVFEGEKRCFLAAGVLGGLLPMIHTHSFFALGLTALCWLVCDISGAYDEGRLKSAVFNWLRFGLTAVLLALPQLLIWTFKSAGGNEQFFRLHLGWVNEGNESFLWFWIKNVGLLFIAVPFAFLKAGESKKCLYTPVFFIFLLCELFVFQPNVYDNNKLLYIGYLFACIMCSGFLLDIFMKIRKSAVKLIVAVLGVTLLFSAGILTLEREYISGTDGRAYQLFSPEETECAAFILENTEPDALFLTADNHDNTVAVLTGRNILCGSGSYLYFHGIDYDGYRLDAEKMLTDAHAFEKLAAKYGIDYVYAGAAEKAGGCITEYFEEKLECVFSNGGVAVYKTEYCE